MVKVTYENGKIVLDGVKQPRYDVVIGEQGQIERFVPRKGHRNLRQMRIGGLGEGFNNTFADPSDVLSGQTEAELAADGQEATDRFNEGMDIK